MEDRRRGGDYCGSRLVGRWLTAPSSLQSPCYCYHSLRRVLRERWEQVAGRTQDKSDLQKKFEDRANSRWKPCQFMNKWNMDDQDTARWRWDDGEKISEAVGGRTSRTHPENDSNPAQEQIHLQRNVILRRKFSEFGTFHSLGYTSGFTRNFKRAQNKNKMNSFSRKS